MFSHLLNEIAPPRQSIWSKDDSVPKPPSRRESNAVSLPLRQRALEPMLLAVTPIKHVGNQVHPLPTPCLLIRVPDPLGARELTPDPCHIPQDDSVRWMGTNSSFSIYDSGPSGRMWQDDSGILFPDAHLSISGLQASGLVAHESSMHESSHLPGLTHLQVSGYSMVDTVDHTFADYIDVSSSDFQATAPPVRLRDESANWQTEPSILEKSIARPAPPPRKSSCTPRPSFDGKDASMSTNIDGTDYHTASSCSLVHVLGPSSAGAQASDSVHCSQTSITQAEGVTNSGEGNPLANAVAEDIASAAPVVDSRERFQTAGCAFTPTNVGIGPMPVRARASDVHHLPNQSARCDSTVLDDPSIVTTLDEADKYYSVNYSGNAVVDRSDDDPEHSRPLTSHVNLLSEATAKQRDGNQGPQTERREPLVASSGVTQWFQAITPFPPLTSPPCPLSHGTA